jgi:hypothetical protein
VVCWLVCSIRCFLLGGERNVVTLGPYRAEITCHKFTVKHTLWQTISAI